MKKSLTAIISAAMLVTSVSAVGFTAVEPTIISASEKTVITSNLAELLENASADAKISVCIWLDDSDEPDYGALAAEKLSPMTQEEAEWYYSLTEEERTDMYLELKREMVKEYHSSKNKEFLEAHNIADEDIGFSSMYTPLIICSLTPAQIYEIAEDDRVETISPNEEFPTEVCTESFTEALSEPKKLTEEEFYDAFISADENFSDGGVMYTYGNKATVKLNDSYYTGENRTVGTVIVYGFETPEAIRYVNANIGDYEYSESPIGFHSGWCYGYITALKDTELLKGGQRLRIVYFADNVLTDLSRNKLNLIEAYKRYGFDVVPYVYTDPTPGDTDCDGMISASDASLVLEAYAMFSTGEKLEVNMTIFDYNNDGEVNSIDASDILAAYSESMTS